jgi:hypothetical protein
MEKKVGSKAKFGKSDYLCVIIEVYVYGIGVGTKYGVPEANDCVLRLLSGGYDNL